MATHRMPLPLGQPDASGSVYPSLLSIELSLTNSKKIPCMVMLAPTGSDIFCELAFKIPKNYVGTPKLVITGVIDGTPANVFGITTQQVSVDDSETADVAYETEDTASNSTWTGYADEDMYEISVPLTPASAYVPDDTVLLKYGRDDSVDTQTIAFLVTGLEFEYADV